MQSFRTSRPAASIEQRSRGGEAQATSYPIIIYYRWSSWNYNRQEQQCQKKFLATASIAKRSNSQIATVAKYA